MAFVVKDRVQETTSTTGTGTLTLSGSTLGFQNFSAIGDGNTTSYTIVSGNDWEVGIGTYTSSGTTLSRDTILESSNSGSAISLSGVSNVFCTYPAERSVFTTDIGVTVQGYDADTAKYDDTTANFTGTLQNGGSNVVVDSDIGSTVQAYDADLTTLGGLSSADGNFIVGSATGWVAESGATARTSLGLGTAATTASTDYATAAQGSLADSAVQPSDNISDLTNDSGYITGNQTITLSGDASGSGTTAITVTVADNSHNHTSANISDATNANTASTIVKRDASGNFSAGTITAALSGNATTSSSTTGSSASCTGNAATATTLQTARTINGVSFNGSANITVEPYIEDDNTTNAARYVIFTDNSAAGYKRLNEDSNFSYNPSTNVVTATTFSGALSGNATTATTLQTGRTIALTGDVTGTSGTFNGSANLSFATNIASNVVGASELNVAGNGTAGQYLASDGDGTMTWTTLPASSAFDSGTLMLFQQTSAPTGWTKQTTHNNKSLRVVSGAASSGGSVAFTTAFASQTPTGSVTITSVTGSAGATTLSTSQMPAHNHSLTLTPTFTGINNWPAEIYSSGYNTNSHAAVTKSDKIANTGGGGSHTHPFSFSSGSGTFSGNAINLAVQYVDLIIASKD
jgi:hypothetical protein